MATTIKLKSGSGAPLAGDLVAAEPALDLTNKRLYTEDSGGTVIEVGTNPSTLTVDTTTLVVDATNNRVGVGTASPGRTLDVDGVIRSNGTSSAFALGGNSSTPTEGAAIHRPANGTIAFVNESSESMRIDSSGNVGIGLTSPAAKLHVDRGASSGAYFYGGSNDRRELIISSGTGDASSLDALHDFNASGASGVLSFSTGSSERMRLSSSGALSINNTTNAEYLRVKGENGNQFGLDNNGSTFTQANWYNNGTLKGALWYDNSKAEFASYSTDELTFYTGGNASTAKATIDSSGNVGIGTASPDGKLNVFSASAGSVSADADADELVLENSGNVGLSLLTASTGESGIYFGNPGTNGQKDFYLKYYHESHATTANRRAFTFNTASTERMRIDSSGNVGIGTTSPNYPLHLNKSDSAGCWAQFTNSTTGTGSAAGALVGIDSNEDFRILQYEAKALALYTSATERMRIDSSGNLLVGTTTDPSSSGSGSGFIDTSFGRHQLRLAHTDNTGASRSLLVFYGGTAGNSVGTITASNSATTYNTTSDQRLKENIVDAPAGNIDAIRVRSFDWKVDGSHQTYGMVAQELVDVAPEAVTQGETEDDMWAVDYSKLVPMMIKEIQDLKAEVAALKGA